MRSGDRSCAGIDVGQLLHELLPHPATLPNLQASLQIRWLSGDLIHYFPLHEQGIRASRVDLCDWLQCQESYRIWTRIGSRPSSWAATSTRPLSCTNGFASKKGLIHCTRRSEITSASVSRCISCSCASLSPSGQAGTKKSLKTREKRGLTLSNGW